MNLQVIVSSAACVSRKVYEKLNSSAACKGRAGNVDCDAKWLDLNVTVQQGMVKITEHKKLQKLNYEPKWPNS